MPKKPNRPLTTLIFPKSGPTRFKQEVLPREKHELEIEITNRFVESLNLTDGQKYQNLGTCDEPGDTLLRDDSGEKIYLQIGEAVDVHRIKTITRRESYSKELCRVPELCSLFRGVQVLVCDTGEIRDLPKIGVKQGRIILEELSAKFLLLRDIVPTLHLNADGEAKGKQTYFNLESAKLRIDIKLLRYEKQKHNSFKWLWTGSHQVRAGDVLENISMVIEGKCKHYSKIDDNFWLMVYSVDTHCDAALEASLSLMLRELDPPFQKVYLFFPLGDAGETKLIYPSEPIVSATEPTEKKKLLFRLLPQDAIPKWDDPRWEEIACEENSII